MAKRLAEEVGYEFQECPIYDLIGRDGVGIFFENLRRIKGELNSDLATMVFGAGNLYIKQTRQNKNIVTDRHLCSTYLFNANQNNLNIFDWLVESCGKPDLTVILYANPETRRNRIKERNPNDPDLNENIFTDEKYDKAVEFVKRYQMDYIVFDNSNLDIDETVEEIKKLFRKIV